MYLPTPGRGDAGGATLTASPFLPEYHDARYARALIWTIALALAGFVAWAAVAPVHQTVSGQGVIRPEGLSQRIEHPEGGVVAHIVVAEGDRVAAGDTLLEFADRDLSSERRKLAAQVARLSRDIARYDALLELDPADLDGDDLKGSPAQGTERPVRTLPTDPALVEDLGFRIAQIDVVRRERAVASARIATFGGRARALEDEIAILEARHARYGRVETGYALSRHDIEELDREILKLRSALDALGGERAVAVAEIARARAQEAELIGAYRFDAARKGAEAREALTSARETIRQIDDRLSRAALVAPVDGIVNGLTVQGVGEVVGAGELLAEIVPDHARAFAEVEIPAERIGGISVGDQASLKVLTYDFTRHGDIDATVTRISPTSFELADGRHVFRVQLAFEVGGIAARDRPVGTAPLPVTPGMTVAASIQSERRTVLSYVLKPLRVISDRAFTEE